MAKGLDVTAYDAAGHGLSGGPRADVERFSDYLDDLDVVLAHVRETASGRPVVLLGHSMGGLVAASHVAERGAAGLAGLVLSSAALHTFPVPRLLEKAAPYVARWRPTQVVTKLDLSKLSHDPASSGRTARTRSTQWPGLARVSRTRSCSRPGASSSTPTPSRCPCCSSMARPTASRRPTARAGSPNTRRAQTSRCGSSRGYYELMKEPDRDVVIGEVVDCISATSHRRAQPA